jgi:YD repeat-containing protein
MNIPSHDSGYVSKKCSVTIDRRYFIGRLCVYFLAAGIFLFSPVRAQAQKILSATETLHVDPTTGTANLNIPIEVRPGRAGLQPDINFFYNSGSPNGKLGLGWVLELGNIQRSTKHGVPKYNATDTFIFVQAGASQELIYHAATNTYQPKIEGAFLKIEQGGNVWTVTDKQGIKYRFGQTGASRQDDPNNSARIFQWCLDRVEDLRGNYMTISYIKDQGQIYPDEIAYTGNVQGLPPFARVKFIYDTARTDVTAHYNAAFKVVTARRLTAVEVRAGSNLMHKYQFSYGYDSETKTSVLRSAQRFASDGATPLPATTFTYSAGLTNLTGAQNVSNYPADNVGNGLTRIIDLNADGYADMIRSPSNGWAYDIFINNKSWNFNPPVQTTNHPSTQLNDNKEVVDLNGDGYPDILFGQQGNYQVWINNQANNFLPPQTSPNSPDIPLSNANIIVLDMNADGFPDLVRSHPGLYKIYLNNGSGNFQSPFNAVNPPPQDLGSGNVRFADFDGDGLVDIIHGTSSTYGLHMNNGGTGFDARVALNLDLTGLAISSAYIGLADMNADGLVDIIRSGDPGQPYYLYFNKGDLSFEAAVTAVNPPAKGVNQAKWMDMNADGLMDIVAGQAQISLNNGRDGFHPAITVSAFPNADLDDAWNMLVDLNADGLPDLLRGAAPEPPYKIYPNPTAQTATSRTGILIASDNGMGGKMNVEYENLPVMPLAGTQYKIASSPTLFNTVKKTVRSLGLNESYTTRYENQKGRWNFANREFRGFEEVKVTDPGGNFTRTIYQQDDVFKGRIQEQMHYNPSGTLLARTVNTWNQANMPSGAKFAFLKRADHFNYDGNPQGRCRAEEYFYEEPQQRGNLTKTVQLGDVSVTGDERTIETTYVHNDSLYMIGFPSRVAAKDAQGNVMRQTWFDYDGQSNGSAPTAGLLTHKKDWAGDGPQEVEPETQYVYDSMGNLKKAVDPLLKETAVTYDQSYNIFPVSTQNALNHSVANAYYGVDGAPLDNGLWGQIKSTTDPNNRQGLRTYDVFGRVKANVSPLDSMTLPTNAANYEINQAGQFYKVTTSQRKVSGQSGTIEQKQFYDGLGRLMQGKTIGGTPGQYIVHGQVEYNARGLPFKQYLPYFTSVALDTPNAIDPSQPRTTIEYDSLGRVTKTINPDGTYATVVYGDMVTTTVDENGHQQKSYFDAYGRMIKKEEYKGADGRSPYYAPASYSLYAATQYEYDSEGNLTRTIDARGNVTTITYDKLGRKIAMNDPDMGVWTYQYDLNGNLTQQTDAKGQTLRFTYDALNRLVNKTDGGALNVSYTYDDAVVENAKGRLTKVQYAGGQTEFEYDPIGREIESIKKINNTNYGVQRSYDALNNLINIQYPDGEKIFYKYNPAGQVEAIANDASLIGL